MGNSIEYGDCELVGCVKNVDEGYVRFNFFEPRHQEYIYINIPIEYWLMAIGKREWHHNIDHTGNPRHMKEEDVE